MKINKLFKNWRISAYTVTMQTSLYILPNIWVSWSDFYVSISFGWLKWTYDIDFYNQKIKTRP